MAQNVKFIKGDTATISGTTIVDGQLLWDTTTGATYMDVATVRKPTGRSASQTLTDGDTNAVSGDAVVNNIINTNTTTVSGYMADARQLNPIISGSLAQKNAQLFGADITIATGDWVEDSTDARYPWAYTKTFATMGASTSFGLTATAINGLTTALEDTENGYVVKGVADNTAKTIKFYATAKPTGSLRYLVKGVTL